MIARMIMSAALALLGWLSVPAIASAQQFGCEVVQQSGFNFGRPGANPTAAVDTTASVTVRCEGNRGQRGDQVNVCVGILPDGQREMTSGGSSLAYQIYREASYSTPWGLNQNGVRGVLTLNQDKPRPSGQVTFTLHGLIAPGQTGLAPGNYRDNFILGFVQSTTNTGANCGDGSMRWRDLFVLSAEAVLAGSCSIIASDLDFGPNTSLAANVDASSSLGLTCTTDTAYKVRLDGGTITGNVGARAMGLNGAAPGLILYELRHTGPSGPLWGDGTSGTSTVAGTGTGGPQTLTVYGRVPGGQTMPPAGLYRDTITATVEY